MWPLPREAASSLPPSHSWRTFWAGGGASIPSTSPQTCRAPSTVPGARNRGARQSRSPRPELTSPNAASVRRREGRGPGACCRGGSTSSRPAIPGQQGRKRPAGGGDGVCKGPEARVGLTPLATRSLRVQTGDARACPRSRGRRVSEALSQIRPLGSQLSGSRAVGSARKGSGRSSGKTLQWFGGQRGAQS